MNRLIFTLIMLVSFNVNAGLFSGFKDFTNIGWLPDIRDTTHFGGSNGNRNRNQYNGLPIFDIGDIPPDAVIGLPGDEVFLPGDDITPVPVPAAVWLFASGVMGMVAVARRKHGIESNPPRD